MKKALILFTVLSVFLAINVAKAQTPARSFDTVDSLLATALGINLNDSTAAIKIMTAKKAISLIADAKSLQAIHCLYEVSNEGSDGYIQRSHILQTHRLIRQDISSLVDSYFLRKYGGNYIKTMNE